MIIQLISGPLKRPGTRKTARRMEAAVQMNHSMTTRTLVQIIDILSNDRQPGD